MSTIGVVRVGHELQTDHACQLLVALMDEVINIQTLIEAAFHISITIIERRV